ncbi:MAG: phosphate regulon sensor histidine kinase PhoR [Candidatus Thiodiazotropha sp. L084R]
MRRYFNIELSQLSGTVLIFLPFGYLSDSLTLSIVLGIAAYLGKHGFYLIKLVHLINYGKPITPPYPVDIWGLIYKELSRHRLRSRKRKRTLNRFASRFRKVTNSIPDGLILLNKSGNIEWANPAANNLVNISWPRDENISLVDRIKQPTLAEYLKNPDYSKPLEFPSPANKAVIVSLRVNRFGGKKAQRLVVVRNITDVYTLNQTRRDFVSNVSHELRTPLTVITGFLENLSDNEMLPIQERPFALMNEQAERMNSIINDLLALSRLEMGEAPSAEKPIAIPELLNRIVDHARILGDQKGGYAISLQVDEDLFLLGEEIELTSAFSNLVFNAIVHTPPGTKIDISWKRDGKRARFAVADSGPGIEQRDIPRLTERFYRADKARSRQSGGTGLGLAIVKHIIGRHDGELQIVSQLEVGSQFICSFPEEATLKKSEMKVSKQSSSKSIESTN